MQGSREGDRGCHLNCGSLASQACQLQRRDEKANTLGLRSPLSTNLCLRQFLRELLLKTRETENISYYDSFGKKLFNNLLSSHMRKCLTSLSMSKSSSNHYKTLPDPFSSRRFSKSCPITWLTLSPSHASPSSPSDNSEVLQARAWFLH